MNPTYRISGDRAIIKIDANVYPLASVKKAMFNYVEKLYMNVKVKGNKIEILVELINNNTDIEIEIKEFLNDCIREALRYEISVETKNIRELILGRALYSSCIKVDENPIDSCSKNNENENNHFSEDEDFDINDIAINWFDRKEKN